MENMFGLREAGGCRQCAECYTLVQTRVNEHRKKLDDLKDVLKVVFSLPKLKQININSIIIHCVTDFA